jgi:hypothetical protein
MSEPLPAEYKQIQTDECGILCSKEVPADEPIILVKIKIQNSFGLVHDYWIRVPPTITTAREAVAWLCSPASEPENR